MAESKEDAMPRNEDAMPRKGIPVREPLRNKVVINTCFGGFGLSDKAVAKYLEKSGVEFKYWEVQRDDPYLVEVVEELGESANGSNAELAIRVIHDDAVNASAWTIQEYDGCEGVDINYSAIEVWRQQQQKEEKKGKMVALVHFLRERLDEFRQIDFDEYVDDWEDAFEEMADILRTGAGGNRP